MQSLKYKTDEEIELILEQLEKCNYNDYAYNVAVNDDVLGFRSTEEILLLINELKLCDYNLLSYIEAVDHYSLNFLTIEEQLKSMEKVKDFSCNICKNNIIRKRKYNKRKFMELSKTMENWLYVQKFKRYKNGIGNPQVYNNGNIKHDINIAMIDNLNDLNKYFDELETKYGLSADIKPDTMVFEYKPIEM